MPERLLPPVVLVLLLALAAVTAAQKAEDVPEQRPDASAPRGQVLGWRSREGRPFWYRLPEKGRESKNLLFILHGTGVPQGWGFWNYPIAAGSFRPGDIVVAPEGMTPGAGKSFNFVQNDEDADQLAGLIRSFKKEFAIERVYLLGHSQGAFFCYWFAGRHPELVDGYVAHAGNLLGNVAHPPLAKEKLAIAILHGRADAVVPVDCATASEKALRELGYRKLKLEIVEGLTEQSGHWPLPGPTARLLDWIDRVSTADAPAAIAVLEQALAGENPVLADLVAFSGRAAELAAKHRGEDRLALLERLERAQAELDAALDRVCAALEPLDAKAKADSPEAALFRLAADAIADREAAKKVLRAAYSARRAETKEVEKCLDQLARRRDAKALQVAAKVLARRFLAAERGELARLVLRLLEQPPEGLDEGGAAELRSLAGAALASDEEAAKGLPRLLARPR